MQAAPHAALHWIAWPVPASAPDSACWWALPFSPRVARLEDALLMEISQVLRLWGGLSVLLEKLDQAYAQATAADHVLNDSSDIHNANAVTRAQARTAWQALARLRLRQHLQVSGKDQCIAMPADALPLWTLTALHPHSAMLQRLGCQSWGDLRALPRAGLSRRMGGRALRVLDEAYGLLPQSLAWLQLPEQFVLRHDLGYPAHSAEAVLHATQPLLRALQSWLQARHYAVLALRLRWHHDLRRIDGEELPAWAELDIRTAQPTQGMEHLQRLLREHLQKQRWRAPVDMLELQALHTEPWAAQPLSCLPSDGAQSAHGLAWHEWVERLSARWGEDCVQRVEPRADHRPEAMQQWQSAAAMPPPQRKSAGGDCSDPWQALWPPWLLQRPEPLAVQNNRPQWQGPLQLRAGPYRLEAGWWEGAQALAVRDYFVAFNEVVGHVWIYRERAQTESWLTAASCAPSWFAQGVYG